MPASGLVIRSAEVEDLPAMKDVFRRAALSNEGDHETFAAHPEFLEYESTPEGATTLVAVDDDDGLVGFASGTAGRESMELVDLFVDPNHMRQGVGRALVRAIVEVARSVGLARLEVDANRHALDFYTHIGFVSQGEVPVTDGSAMRMSLPVDEPTATSEAAEG